jgi:hypothetical protein
VAQFIDLRYKSKVESDPLNKRFKDITGPCVLYGFRFQKGTAAFKVSLIKSGYDVSAAISPSGAKVEEDADLIDALTIDPNPDPAVTRIDSIYMIYEYGTHTAVATYIVVPGNAGTGNAAPNPNPLTHTLLGYINVMPNSVDLKDPDSFNPLAYGLNQLEVSGPSFFHGPVVFDKPVTFSDGTVGGGTPGGTGSARVVRLPVAMVATTGQKQVTLPQKYTVGSNAIFFFVDWVPQSPDVYFEVNNTTIEFHDAFKGGELLWAYWFQDLNLYTLPPHDHNDLYYQKSEIDQRRMRYFQDTMNGPTGRTLTHNLGNQNYVIAAITPTSRTTDVGQISVERRDNDMIVYNSGGYRGSFDLTYFVKT